MQLVAADTWPATMHLAAERMLTQRGKTSCKEATPGFTKITWCVKLHRAAVAATAGLE
jgi:hypothetical protein